MPTSTSQLGDDNIVVNHAAHLAAQAQWLLGLLRQLHDQGVALEEGKRIQIGWSMISFRLAEPHLLVVTEPDYARFLLAGRESGRRASLRLWTKDFFSIPVSQ